MAKSETLPIWQLAMIEQAIRAYDPLWLTDDGKEQWLATIKKIANARKIRLTYVD